MEEFRPIVVDAVVMRLVNRRQLVASHFQETGKDGIYLTRPGLQIFFQAYQDKLNSEVTHPLVQRTMSYQKIFELQARQLRKVIEGTLDTYIPFQLK